MRPPEFLAPHTRGSYLSATRETATAGLTALPMRDSSRA